jgi:hypothetical protein
VINITIRWLHAKPERIKATIAAVVHSLAKQYEGDPFEVYGTLALNQPLKVKVDVTPDEMALAIATYALKDIEVSYDDRESEKNPCCKS